MNYESLAKAISGDAALRRRQRLQPVGGAGDKLLPPTYPEERRGQGPRHVYERRHVDGRELWCVLLDSVQSQANRLEEALLAALRDDGIVLPYVTVDFRAAQLAGLTEITSLEAPHRIYDAILRDSSLGGEPFMKSPLGLHLAEAKPAEATAILEVSPTALLFGAWHSTGEGGGLGAKFPRCLVSEIIAIDVPVDPDPRSEGDARASGLRTEVLINVDGGTLLRTDGEVRTAGRRTGSRIDPLGILRKVEVFRTADGSWDTKEQKGAKKVRPSEINHGNIAPSVEPLGVTCAYAEHSAVLSFAGLRRLGFGGGARDRAGRALLAALGLLALTQQDRRGYALRSRCDLVCEGRAPIELVHADGATQTIDLDADAALALYQAAVDAARAAGFELAAEPVRLTPQPKLIDIVRQSQRLALEGKGGEAEDEK